MTWFRSLIAASLCGTMAASALKAEDAQGADPQPRYKVLAADNGHLARVDPAGKVEWEVPVSGTPHDLQLLPNGNILYPPDATTVAEITPAKDVVWKYVSRPRAGYKGPIEVHAFRRLPDGLTMIAESGNRRIIEVDRDGKIVHEIPLTVDHPNAHKDTRLVRKLADGHYLVCHEADGVVREYDGAGKVVWSYALDLAGRPAAPGHGPEGHGNDVFGALRLANGNTLIAAGNGNRVIEVTPAGKVVWSLGHDELPGIRLAWVTTLQLRPNGNLIVGNCHAGPENPQLIEVTRDKKVAWTFRDFSTFGNSVAAALVLDGEDAGGR